MISEELASAIFRRAIADGRAAELLEALFDGGMVVLDPVDDRLRIVSGDEFRERFGTPAMGDVVRDAVEYANSGVDPTSPTYDPDQYGTPDTGEAER